ncbi:hypothetical protein HPP92_024644 [Vanilla planifolia]|uniref:Integrator complex subunit 7 n=1 Tax=Vanilla planifolia TaxID=51239 RepID=A0A835PSH8_VANPL|nr:hypothetical protein HPP92_024644 [Vanilla planifolia]
MKKIPAACAMEWSIELEKGLRSKKSGHSIEAIRQIGHRLLLWSMEPSITMPISEMYGMIPGEDSLFANTILLRLADAFRYGNVEVRRCILQIFLAELQHIEKKGRLYNGILSRKRVPNYLELLKRVKAVFDTGDIEAKSLALRLVGCWGNLAMDSTQIRFLILTSLQSAHGLEVKASLFAAGCFCRLSEDFGCIMLEILICMISSVEVSHDVKLAAIRTLSKLQCSSSTTIKAYQAGKQLLLAFSMDDAKAVMLLSLSKMALVTSQLFPEQIQLLLSYISHQFPVTLKVRALRCLLIMFTGGTCHFHVNKDVISILISLLDDNAVHPEVKCLALQNLQKIFSNKLLHLSTTDIPDLFKLITMVQDVNNSKVNRGPALRLIVRMFSFFKEAVKERHFNFLSSLLCSSDDLGSSLFQPSCEHCTVILFRSVFDLIMDQVNSLLKETTMFSRKELKGVTSVPYNDANEKKELKKLLNLILHFSLEFPSSGLFALSKLKCMVKWLACMLNEASRASEKLPETAIEEKYDFFGASEFNGQQITVVSDVLLCMLRFTNAFLQSLHETSSISSEVLLIVKDVVSCIKQCGHSCSDSHEVFCLSLYSFLMPVGSQKGNEDKPMGIVSVDWPHQETLALEFIKKILQKGNFWAVYRAGKYSCLQGLWFAATFSFRKLLDIVNSDRLYQWIKALMLFVGSESEIKLLLFPRIGMELIHSFQSTCDRGKLYSCTGGETSFCAYEFYNWNNTFRGNLASVCSRICSSEKVFESPDDADSIFIFQRWFLNLRGKVLQTVVEILGVLNSYVLAKDKCRDGMKTNRDNGLDLIEDMHALASDLARVSGQLNSLAKCYDILAASFMDIDAMSFASISKLGLSCSILAFCTSFACNFLCSNALRNMTFSSAGKPESLSNFKIVQDLAQRLWEVDYTMARKLQQLVSVGEETAYGLCSRTRMRCSGSFYNASSSLFQPAIEDILCVEADLNVAEGMEDLIAIFIEDCNVFVALLKMDGDPLLTPKYFFRVRSCIGAELFMFNANAPNADDLSINPGFQLSLNMCIQLKNASGMICTHINKIYCVLVVRESDSLANGIGRRLSPVQSGFQSHNPEEMLWLNEILLLFLKINNKGTDLEHHDLLDGSFSTAFVCFEPNRMGMGFSTCLLDVSRMPKGSYLIKWHSCCVDDRGFYWNLIPFNRGAVFTIKPDAAM